MNAGCRSFLMVRQHQGDAMIAIAPAPAPSQTATVPDTCACGQDLDCCERAHCPRCGCQIGRHAA